MRVPERRDHGFTLVELLLVIVMTSLIVGAIASAMVVGLRSTDQAGSRLSESVDTQLLSAYLPQDVQSAGIGAGDLDTAPGASAGCFGLSGSNALALRGTDPATSAIFGITYRTVPDAGEQQLVRFACTGGGVSERRVIARNLAAAGGAVAAVTASRVSLTLTMTASSASDAAYTTTVTAYRRTPSSGGSGGGGGGGGSCAIAGTPSVAPPTSSVLAGVLVTPPTLTVTTTGSCGRLVVRYAPGADPLATRDQALNAVGSTHAVVLTATGWTAGAHPLSVYDATGALLNSPNFVVTDPPAPPTCAVTALAADPTSGTRLGNGRLSHGSGATAGSVTVTATTDVTCGPLTLIYDSSSSTTTPSASTVAFTLTGTNRTATIPGTTSWTAGQHTFLVKDASGTVLRPSVFTVDSCVVSASSIVFNPSSGTRNTATNKRTELDADVVVDVSTTGTCTNLRLRYSPTAGTSVIVDLDAPKSNRPTWQAKLDNKGPWDGSDPMIQVLDASDSVLAEKTLVVN